MPGQLRKQRSNKIGRKKRRTELNKRQNRRDVAVVVASRKKLQKESLRRASLGV